jgi:hypothetical protein
MTETPQQAHDQLRLALETRLRQALKIDTLPAMSIGEIVSLLFAMYGHLDLLGGYGTTMAAIHKLVGSDLLWKPPQPAEPATAPTVH